MARLRAELRDPLVRTPRVCIARPSLGIPLPCAKARSACYRAEGSGHRASLAWSAAVLDLSIAALVKPDWSAAAVLASR